MNNMHKLKALLAICGLSLTLFLGGCSSTTSTSSEPVEEAADVQSQQDAMGATTAAPASAPARSKSLEGEAVILEQKLEKKEESDSDDMGRLE